MATIVTRTGKGSPLTHVEVDTNFTNLNTAKLEAGAIALGSAAAPSISFTGDTNTGIYSPGADQLAISTNGTGRLFVDASGFISATDNIGIGGPAGTDRRFSADITGVVGMAVGFNDSGTTNAYGIADNCAYVGVAQAFPLAFSTTGQERLRITSAGLVGIGTSSPTENLTVYGTGSRLAVTGPSAFSAILLGNQDSLGANNPSVIGGANGELYFGGGSSWNGGGTLDYNMFISDLGRVGIGTTSPGKTLEVSTASSTDGIALSRAGSNRVLLTADGLIAWGATANQGTLTWDTNQAIIRAAASNSLVFAANNSSEHARIDTSGRLLVGTSTSTSSADGFTPSIQVAGTGGLAAASIGRYSGDAFQPQLQLQKSRGAIGAQSIVSSGDTLGQVTFEGSDGAAFKLGASITAEVDGTPGANDMPGRLVFSTTADGASSPTERMRITSAGVVDINSGKFKVNSNGDTDISISNDANANGFVFDTGDGGAGNRPKFRIRYSTADQILLDGFGNAEKPGGGSWAAISDSRAKEDIVDYTSGLDKLKQIQPRSYRYIGNENTYIGLVAQEVEDAMPELVKQGEGTLPDGTEVTDFRTLDQTPLTFALINAVKEMAATIEILEAKVAALEAA